MRSEQSEHCKEMRSGSFSLLLTTRVDLIKISSIDMYKQRESRWNKQEILHHRNIIMYTYMCSIEIFFPDKSNNFDLTLKNYRKKKCLV